MAALLPDALGRLSAHPGLDEPAFRRILAFILQYVDKDRQSDALVDKLLARLPDALAAGGRAAADVAFCVGALPPLGERGLRKLADGWKLYEPALGDSRVADGVLTAVRAARKAGKPEARAAADELEARVRAAAAERAEGTEAARRAGEHAGAAAGRAAAGGEGGEGGAEGAAAAAEGERQPAAVAAAPAQRTSAAAARAKTPAKTPARKPAARKGAAPARPRAAAAAKPRKGAAAASAAAGDSSAGDSDGENAPAAAAPPAKRAPRAQRGGARARVIDDDSDSD